IAPLRLITTTSGGDGRAIIHSNSVLGFLSFRVLEVAARAAQGKRQPLLALPTHPGGHIDPNVLAARRRELQRRGIAADQADALQAALRAGEVRAPEQFRYDYGTEMRTDTYFGKTYSHVHFHVRVHPRLNGQP